MESRTERSLLTSRRRLVHKPERDIISVARRSRIFPSHKFSSHEWTCCQSLAYDRLMSLGGHINQWCQFRGITLSELAEKTGVQITLLQSLQSGDPEIPVSLFDTISGHLNIPTAWLHYDPQVIQRLWNDPDEDHPQLPPVTSSDPLFQRILQTSREYQDIFVTLTSLLHHGDLKLIRAAQVSLQSLLKQARPTTVPWGSRPPGHFEPPSD
jgi:transcriptional regulator with XRE-family HTH domain